MTVTALSAGNSLANPDKADIFASEASILRALSFVRSSAIPLAKKDALRDLFLAYAGTAEEAERVKLKSEIVEVLKTQPELASLLPQEKSVPAVSSLGMSRPVPTFGSDVGAVAAPTIPEAPAVVVSPKPMPPPPPEPVPPPPPAAVPPVAPPPAPPPQTANAKARIDAIKRDINARVGNPVNLIETNETVGREYMTALLDAMKRSSRGDGDLSRLETAYQAALAAIEKGPAPEPVKVTPPPPPAPKPEVVVPPPPPEATPKTGLYHRPVDEVELPPVKVTPPPPAPEIKLPEPEPAVVPTIPVVTKVKISNATNPDSASDTKLRPLNETSSALPEQISKLKVAAAAREEAAKKPITDLKAPEIDQGLRLLLAEWVLFKNSGFLRRKPSGIDSPLYKQLAPLPMASVIAGRFEGVTPDIKHTLADYMTGWRYEQGIIHDMGETFEHYLRRVVKEILEKQRAAKSAEKPAAIK